MTDGVLSAVGGVPLVRLERFAPDLPFRMFAKLEGLNPGGSIKDRAAISIIRHALETGEIGPGTVVIESSSGNMGIGLAQACAYLGLRFLCVIDAKTTEQNVRILRAYGADVDLVAEPDPETGEFLKARLDRVARLRREIPNSYWPDQYSNDYNAKAHYRTMDEIATALDGRVDFLFCATSTCGTIRGCGDYVREKGLPTNIVGVDAVGSVIFGGRVAKRLIPGHGAAIVPALLRRELVTRTVHVSDLDCVVGCRRLVRSEGILAGGSAGGVVMAAERLRPEIPAGATCVLIFPDRGERYLDTIYSDGWVREHFGDVASLWETPVEQRA
jgi:cysteine synthase A